MGIMISSEKGNELRRIRLKRLGEVLGRAQMCQS